MAFSVRANTLAQSPGQPRFYRSEPAVRRPPAGRPRHARPLALSHVTQLEAECKAAGLTPHALQRAACSGGGFSGAAPWRAVSRAVPADSPLPSEQAFADSLGPHAASRTLGWQQAPGRKPRQLLFHYSTTSWQRGPITKTGVSQYGVMATAVRGLGLSPPVHFSSSKRCRF